MEDPRWHVRAGAALSEPTPTWGLTVPDPPHRGPCTAGDVMGTPVPSLGKESCCFYENASPNT